MTQSKSDIDELDELVEEMLLYDANWVTQIERNEYKAQILALISTKQEGSSDKMEEFMSYDRYEWVRDGRHFMTVLLLDENEELEGK